MVNRLNELERLFDGITAKYKEAYLKAEGFEYEAENLIFKINRRLKMTARARLILLAVFLIILFAVLSAIR